MTSAHFFIGTVLGVSAKRGRSRSLALSVLGTFTPCVIFAQNGPTALTVLSAASYQKTVSPNSLAVVFGTNLSATSLSGQLDASGQYPTTLGGTTVLVNGDLARLLYVSPTQIDLLIPSDIKPGTATVVATPSNMPSVSGTAMVTLAAPGLFSSDGTGQGPGAILNGVTFTPGPFFVTTPENSGTDKRTRLAMYGTGIRYAGNPKMDPTMTNVATNVAVQILDNAGVIWPLTVEYAGAAPVYAGLDQINVVLPQGLDGAGIVGLTVSVAGNASNVVTIVIASLVPPVISSLSASSGPPGTQIQISGTGFAPNIESQLRTQVYVDLPDGSSALMPAINVTPTNILTMLPPIPTGAQGSWYSGPAKLCVKVDGQMSCAPGSIQISSRLISAQAPGQVTLTSLQQLQQSLAGLPFPGNPILNTYLQQQSEFDLSRLTDIINQAAMGKAPLIQLTQPDGSTISVPFTLTFLQDVDSLLLASPEYVTSVRSFSRGDYPVIPAAQTCGLPSEQNLGQIAITYQAFLSTQESLNSVFFLALAAEGIGACLAAGPLCLPVASAAVAASLPTAVLAYSAASWSLFAGQVGIETQNAFLQSLSASPAMATLEVQGSTGLTLSGTFVAKYSPGDYSAIIKKALGDLLAQNLAPICGPEGSPLHSFCDWFSGEVIDEYLKDTSGDAAPPENTPTPSYQAELSSYSVSVSPQSTPEVSLQLACTASDGKITALAPTPPAGELFGFAANGSLLVYDALAPAATVTVLVNQPARIQSLSLSPTSVNGGDSLVGTVILTRAAPKGGFPIQLSSSSIDAPLPTPSFTIPEGQNQQTFSINTRPVSATETVTISASSADQTVSATFSIVPSPSTMILALSPSSVNGGDLVTGTVSFTPALAVAATVLLTSDNPAAQVPGSVQVPAAGVGTFTISTTSVSSPQTATLNATYGSSRASATLQINPASSVALAAIQLDKSAVTGGDTVFGTVTLSALSPTGGTTVQLQSSDPSIALVQASTIIPGGQASARFSISTYAVSSARTVTITGTAGGATKSTSLVINPAGTVTLSGFSVAPNPIYGGSAATGTLMLSDLAPSGGATVTVQSSDSSLVQVPATVTIPQAADSYDFVITTTPVDGSESVIVTATYKGSSASLIVTLFPVDKAEPSGRAPGRRILPPRIGKPGRQ